jgi:hypothetical protein
MLAVSYNRPKYSQSTNWGPDAQTFANSSAVGRDIAAVFVSINNTIYTATRESKQILLWHNASNNPPKTISGHFLKPNVLFVTPKGDIYIDNGEVHRRVEKWTSNTNTWSSVLPVHSQCFGIFVDINDALYCSLVKRHQVIKKWSVNSTTTVAGTGQPGAASDMLNTPQGIFVHINFDLYVADCKNNRIQCFRSGELNGITVAGGKLSSTTVRLKCPSGIILSADNDLFILDNNNHRIIGLGPTGFRCLVGCSGRGSGSNQLTYPFSFSFDSFGNMFVADKDNGRIQKFPLSIDSCGKYEYN